MASSTPKVVKAIRKLRHYKQRFRPGARFVWRKPTEWPNEKGKGRTLFPSGSIIPDYVIKQMGRAKLGRFWASNRIELLEFDSPNVLTGRVDINDPMQIKQAGGKKKKAAAKKPKATAKGNGAAKKKAARKPRTAEQKAASAAKRAATIARKKAEAAAADGEE